jgi:hypothetical protein
VNTFCLLFGSILRSSIWVQENKETRLVWITILALKDKDGCVYASKVGLADSAKVSPEECAAALVTLLSPDPNDTSGVYEGRRIVEIPGGWRVINNDLYRFSTEAKREIWRQQKAVQRAKKPHRKKNVGDDGKPPSAGYMNREIRFVEAEKNGNSGLADKIAGEGLK